MSISAISSGLVRHYPAAMSAEPALKSQPNQALHERAQSPLQSTTKTTAESSAAPPLRPDAELADFRRIDRQVRAHERAHARVGGAHTGPPQYSFQRGPDGQRYAIAGQVQIDTSRIAGDPQATVEKMQIVQAAALAPLDPSAQDRRVAAQAQSQELAAKRELLQQASEQAAEPSKTRINLFV